MRLAETSIRRPVLATVMSLLILLVGGVAFTLLPLREYPKIDEPVVTVDTRYAGASSEVIEAQVTKPLEDSLAGIEGVDVLSSISRQESSQITVRFKLSRDPDSAASDVRDRVARVRNRLPQAIDEPVIAKVEADANPIIWLAFTSETMAPLAISDMANRVIKPRLQTLPGAADVRVFGERRYSMRIWLDADRLASYRLTVQDVEDALRRQNLEVPAGRIESQQREFNVTSQTSLGSPREFGQIALRNVNGYTVRLADVARIEQAAASERSSVRFNGRDAVSMGVIRQATANPLELSKALNAAMPALRAELPPGVDLTVANDNTVFISESIRGVYITIAEAVVLVALVVFVFLRTVRASIVPLVTIPVSLVGAFALMALAGFTVNTLTLLALVLAIGLVVDDAIVVLENIHRHIEEGLKPMEAAIKGVREIGFAVIAMTLTLAAVFAPLAFTPGRTGRLFVEFALTLAGAVIISGFVALTLSPMMCSKLLKHNPSPGWFDRTMERALNGMTRGYGRLLAFSLRYRWAVVLIMLASGAASWWVFSQMKQELAPMEDRGTILAIANGPDGATLAYTQKYMQGIERIGFGAKEFDRIFVISGNPTPAQGIAFLRTVPWSERERTTMELARELGPRFAGLPGVQAFPVTPPSIGGGFRERPLSFVITTSDTYENLSRVAQAMLAEMAKNPGLVQADSDLRLNKPEIMLQVDRERAADLGVSVEAAARTVETMLGGRPVTRYQRQGEQYDVIVQTTATNRDTPDDIDKLYVRGRGEELVPLSAVVRTVETVVPRELNHFNQRRSVTITANLAADYSLGDALKFMDEAAARVLKPGYSTQLAGQSREFKSSSGSLTLVFALALLFIFLVLSAQFESFIDPLVIMVSVPLSMIGALLALQWSGGSINVFSQIGLITLVGLITKHGILIVEFSNQLRRQGVEMMQAVRQAAELRLRPILMTTGAMVLGAIPLALSTGAGAESRRQIGWVVVGGMSLGTLLTIFVVPTVYTLLARRKVPGELPMPAEPAHNPNKDAAAEPVGASD